ncbi:MAG: NUDIX domain-containing protein [Bifidobacterium sp.]|nr:NUDIX domain-containing protein [Bifidobacterium sp.]
MAVPPFILDLRAKIGHDPLWLPGITFVILRWAEGEPCDNGEADRTTGTTAATSESRVEVLLVQRSDNGQWTPITGIVDPGEEPATAAVREAWEEASVRASIRALQRVQVVGPVVYDNGDVTSYVDTAFWGTLAADFDGHAAVGDDESIAVAWTDTATVDSLEPPMNPRFVHLIADAVRDFRSGTISPAAWGPHT